jgi:Tetratrico peptide repeat
MVATPDDELAALTALRAAGEHEQVHPRAVALARAFPDDVRTRLLAAYACDRLGLERDAIGHYRAAWDLGVPVEQQRRFLVGFGSTLRNVGCAEEAVARLGEAVAVFPDYPALSAFLALALHSHGHHALALATMIEASLGAIRHGGFDGYERALAHYQAELIAAGLGAPGSS